MLLVKLQINAKSSEISWCQSFLSVPPRKCQYLSTRPSVVALSGGVHAFHSPCAGAGTDEGLHSDRQRSPQLSALSQLAQQVSNKCCLGAFSFAHW